MSATTGTISFADSGELRDAVKIFTGTYDSSKQQLISTYGEIRHWDVSNVTDMSHLFISVRILTLTLVCGMYQMSLIWVRLFFDCPNFNSDISLWDVSNVTDMDLMFSYCDKFNSDISKWDVSKCYRYALDVC